MEFKDLHFDIFLHLSQFLGFYDLVNLSEVISPFSTQSNLSKIAKILSQKGEIIKDKIVFYHQNILNNPPNYTGLDQEDPRLRIVIYSLAFNSGIHFDHFIGKSKDFDDYIYNNYKNNSEIVSRIIKCCPDLHQRINQDQPHWKPKKLLNSFYQLCSDQTMRDNLISFINLTSDQQKMKVKKYLRKEIKSFGNSHFILEMIKLIN